MKMEVRYTGIQKVLKKIGIKQKALTDMLPAIKKALTLYYQWVLKNFEAEGGLHKDQKYKWEALADSTIRGRRTGSGKGKQRARGKSKKKARSSNKILQDTGALRRDWDLIATSKYGILKSKKFYSRTHEDGAIIKIGKGRIKIPQRKIFPTTEQGNEIVKPAFKKHLNGGVS